MHCAHYFVFLFIHIPIQNIQDGVTADEVAEVHGYHAVGEELRKHMHGDCRPLSKVRSMGTSILVGYVKQTYRLQNNFMAVHTNSIIDICSASVKLDPFTCCQKRN